MSKKRKILAGIILGGLAIASLLFFFYLERPEDPVREQNQAAESAFTDDQEDSEKETLEDYPVIEEVLPQPPAYLEVTQADCGNECQSFAGNSEKLAYCRSYCGLSEVEGQAPTPAGSCEEKPGIERDRCIKDEAVREKNIGRCNDIYDQNLKKSCQARVTEEYLP